MNDSGIEVSTVVSGLAGVLATVLGWIGIRLHGRVDKLSADAIRREEFDNVIGEFRAQQEQNREERREMHKENQRELREINTAIRDLLKANYGSNSR